MKRLNHVEQGPQLYRRRQHPGGRRNEALISRTGLAVPGGPSDRYPAGLPALLGRLLHRAVFHAENPPCEAQRNGEYHRYAHGLRRMDTAGGLGGHRHRTSDPGVQGGRLPEAARPFAACLERSYPRGVHRIYRSAAIQR